MNYPPEVLPASALQTIDSQAAPEAAAQALQALPNIMASLASLHRSREPLAAALDTIDKEIDRVMTAGHQAMSACGARHFETAESSLELKTKVVYKPTDWPAIQQHIVTSGEFDLLHRRLSTTALNQRTEMPPGIMRATFDEPHFAPVKVNK